MKQILICCTLICTLCYLLFEKVKHRDSKNDWGGSCETYMTNLVFSRLLTNLKMVSGSRILCHQSLLTDLFWECGGGGQNDALRFLLNISKTV